MNATIHHQDLRRLAESVYDSAECVAAAHEDLGPEVATVVAAVTLLNSPTIVGFLRRIAVGMVAGALTIGDVILD